MKKYKIIGVILLFSIVLRGISISDKPLWYDEAFSVLFAESGIDGMVKGTIGESDSAAEEHPLGYYTILMTWVSIFGSSSISVRALSILFGIATILFCYKLITLLFDDKTATLASFFIAISPFHVRFSQEVRMYSLLTFFIFLASYSLWQAIQKQHFRWWFLFSLFSAFAQYTHNGAFIFLLPLAYTPILLRDKKSINKVLASGFFSIILYLPWLYQIQKQLSKIQNNYWMTTPGIEKFFTTLLTFVMGLPTFESMYAIGFIFSIFIFVISLLQTRKIVGRKDHFSPQSKWILLMTFAPPMILFIVSQWIPIYIERLLLPSALFFLIWIAWIITDDSIEKPPKQLIFAIIIFSSLIGNLYNFQYRGFPYGQFKQITASLSNENDANTIIVHSNKLTFLPSFMYDSELPQVFIADAEGGKTDTFGDSTQYILGVTSYKSIEVATAGNKKVILIIFSKEVEEYKLQGISPHPMVTWLDNTYSLINLQTIDAIEIFTFHK